ncbi:MAG: hypothetical protein C5B56_05285 [Proteobacteria bacterium]|nr:MAG: hypothetical protein C5B56_05285 [Pseudomonadota bacterium]
MADKTFSQLLAELKAIDEPKPRLLVKSRIGKDAHAGVKKPPAQITGPALGLLLKSAINDAVAAGRLSGTAAVAGMKALGLEP